MAERMNVRTQGPRWTDKKDNDHWLITSLIADELKRQLSYDTIRKKEDKER